MKRYLKSVHLKNFQSYKDETITFSPGLNILVGSSDSGKTAILRAISFVLHNSPKKDTMIHYGETEMAVTLEFSDGVKVTRTKGEGVNRIDAIDSNGKELHKTKIDKQIPDDIKELLGNPPVDDFNGFISYADLYSSLFLVDLSPTELPRALSHLTGVELLEDAAKQLMQSYGALEKTNKKNLTEWEKTKKELESFEPIKAIDKKIANFEKQVQHMAVLEANIEKLNKYSMCLGEFSEQKTIELIDGLLIQINGRLNDIEKIRKLNDKLTKIEQHTVAVNSLSICQHDKKIIALYDSISTKGKEVGALKTKEREYQSINEISDKVEEINSKGKRMAEEFRASKTQAEELEDEYNKFCLWLKENQIQCEVCGGALK